MLPPTSAVQLTLDQVLFLQAVEEPKAPKAKTATDLFLEEARKPPMQRLREQIMAQLGLTEEDLAQMTPEERQATETTIRELIEEKFRQANGAGDTPDESAGSFLKTLV